MAQPQLITQKGNVPSKPESTIMKITDWESYLYSLWPWNMDSNPELFDDAMLQYVWRCGCRSRTLFLMEEHKKK
jgi:hypothetical protein